MTELAHTPLDTAHSIRKLQLFGFGSVAAMLALFGVWTALADINGAVIAPATIQAESYSKKVQHREGGNVLKIMVRDGDIVAAGQELITLDPTETQAELGIIQGQMDELRVKRARLLAQRDGEPELTLPEDIKARATEPSLAEIIAGQQKLLQSTQQTIMGKQEQYKVQAGQFEEEIKGIGSQIIGSKKQLSLINQEVDGLKKLQAQGLVPASRIMSMDREAARISGEQGQLDGSKASLEAKISETKLQMLQVEEDARTQALTDLRDTEAKIGELEGRQVASKSRLAHLSIKAPITGTIYQMAVHTEGGVIAANEPLMMILPQGDDLVLQAQVAPNDIDHVHIGQPAEVVFNSFDSRITPKISAQVTQVAADTTKQDQQTPAFYVVRLTISAKELEKLGKNKLKPGMSAEAFIQTESRSPFSYLVKPLIQQWSHAMRESY